jgi:hypothetical protein
VVAGRRILEDGVVALEEGQAEDPARLLVFGLGVEFRALYKESASFFLLVERYAIFE